MTDLVSRKEAIKAFRAWWDDPEDARSTKQVIESLPTIEPVKHGKWDKISDRNYKCSSCNAWWTVDRDSTIKDFEYCPHCGARMDGE